MSVELKITPLEGSILATICYFDVFNYPLTLFELWKWQYHGTGHGDLSFSAKGGSASGGELIDIQKALEESRFLKENVSRKEGFYFLKGQEKNLLLRKERYLIAEKKFQKALKVAGFFRLFPFIKMIGICNTLAYANARPESDIDFFIITSQKRIWTTRFFTTFFTKIFSLRPTNENSQDKICLSFFVTEDNLNLQKIKLGEEDIYLSYWISQVVPIYNPKGRYQKFWQENQWREKDLPAALSYKPVSRRQMVDNFITLLVKKSKEFFLKGSLGDLIEQWLKKIQLKIMPENLKALANKDSRVIIQDKMLKFHDNDRRERFKEMFLQKLRSIINN